MVSLGNLRTAHFYLWEYRGRGWLHSDHPVMIEPPWITSDFTPPRTAPDPNEGRQKSFFNQALSGIRSAFNHIPPQIDEVETWIQQAEEELIPYQEEGYSFHEYRMLIPRELGSFSLAPLFQALGQTSYPLSFEILADANAIELLFTCSALDQSFFLSQFQAYFPSIALQEVTMHLDDFVYGAKHGEVLDFGYTEEFMRPLAYFEKKAQDPFIGLFGLFNILRDSQRLAVQVLFQGCQNSWGKEISSVVKGEDGKSLFFDAPEMVSLAQEKSSCDIFATRIRVMVGDNSKRGVRQLSSMIPLVIHTMSASQYNALCLLSPLTTDFNDLELFTSRLSCRTGMLLNAKELATFVHIPGTDVGRAKMHIERRVTVAAPDALTQHPFVLGTNTYRGVQKEVGVTTAQRLRHCHIIGATGTGKSTLLFHLLKQDIESGNGCALLDPHGDLVDSLLSIIPKRRHADVLIIDPSDADFPVGLGVLHATSDIEKVVLSSDLVGLFKRLSTSWGDQMSTILANAIDAFLYHKHGGSLYDLRKFLADEGFRTSFLHGVQDETIRSFWDTEFPLLRKNSMAPLLIRLDSFLRPRLIRNMMMTTKGIDVHSMVNDGKIILIKLSQGLIGEDNAYLLGSLLVAKIQQAAQARQNMPAADRKPFFLYIDEFQYFAVPSMTGMLSGARKFGLGLILAHQDLQQLASQDTALMGAVLSNAGTRICFRLGDADAGRLEKGFESFSSFDLQNLGVGQAIVRIDQASQDFSLETITHAYEHDQENVDAVVAKSRSQFARKIATDTPSVHEVSRKISVPPETSSQEIDTPPKDITSKQEQFIEETRKRTDIKEHTYLQQLIKKTVETLGFRAVIEEETTNPSGRVDVALYINGQKVAIEVSVTTPPEYEVQNIKKCIDNGFSHVISLSSDKKHLHAISELARTTLTKEELDLVHFLSPEELFSYLSQANAPPPPEERSIKGYRVRVKYSDADIEKQKKDAGGLAKLFLKRS